MSIEVPIIILIIALSIYILSKWLLKKLNLGNAKSRWYLASIPAIILSPVLYVGIVLIWIFSISYYPKTDFNRQQWVENKEERYKMSDDIIKTDMLIGKTKKEVIDILGDDFSMYKKNHLIYNLGFVPGLSNIDPDVLDICFENGKVIRVIQYET